MRGALWALGFIVAVGSFGFAVLTTMGAAMSDSPSGSAEAMSGVGLYAGIGVVGLAMIGAGFWF
jgi:hypothetical protein